MSAWSLNSGRWKASNKGKGFMKRNKLKITFLRFISILILLTVYSKPLPAEKYNTPTVEPIKGELGYKNRGNRYEGFYQKRCGGNMSVVSLLSGEFDFAWNPAVVLQIRAPNPIEGEINVRAVAIPLKTYYRMDGVLRPPRSTLRWPIGEVIYKARLRPASIGLFGWISNGQGKKYVPLKVVKEGRDDEKGMPVVLMVRAEMDVETLAYRFSDVDMGRCSKSRGGWQKIDCCVTAGDPIKIEIPGGSVKELCVEIRAKPRNSGTWLPLKVIIVMG